MDRALAQLRKNSWAWLLKRVLLPVGDLASGQKMMRRLSFLEEAQWMPSEQLYSIRDQSLSELIKLVYNEVPFYRELMDKASVKPAEIQKAADLRKLPIVTKEMLRSGYPNCVTRNTGRKVYESRSSGSTGANFVVAMDSETAGWYRASFLLALEWAGWKMGEAHIQTGVTLNREFYKRIKDELLNCHYVSGIDLTDSHLDRILETMDRYSIQHIWGYPGGLYYLARRAAEQGWNQPLRTIVTWGENLFSHYRTTLEETFKVRVTDTYGCSEGMNISAQCGVGSVYHVHTLDVIIEYLDDCGEPVDPSQPGNLILTRLHPGPMPLIRYKVGDVGISGESRICTCGRGYDVMESIQGRDTDVVLTPGGNRLTVQFFIYVLKYFSEIDSFQIVQESPECIILRVVSVGDFSTEIHHKIIDALRHNGADINIELELVKEIPLPPSGKRRFIISQLDKTS